MPTLCLEEVTFPRFPLCAVSSAPELLLQWLQEGVSKKKAKAVGREKAGTIDQWSLHQLRRRDSAGRIGTGTCVETLPAVEKARGKKNTTCPMSGRMSISEMVVAVPCSAPPTRSMRCIDDPV